MSKRDINISVVKVSPDSGGDHPEDLRETMISFSAHKTDRPVVSGYLKLESGYSYEIRYGNMDINLSSGDVAYLYIDSSGIKLLDSGSFSEREI